MHAPVSISQIGVCVTRTARDGTKTSYKPVCEGDGSGDSKTPVLPIVLPVIAIFALIYVRNLYYAKAGCFADKQGVTSTQQGAAAGGSAIDQHNAL